METGHQMGAALGWPLVWVEEYAVARTLLTWAVGVQRSGGSLLHLPQSLIELAELDFRVGRWVPALAGAYEAIALFEETAQRTELGFAQATIARMEAALGRTRSAAGERRRASPPTPRPGLLLASVLAGAALGLLELGRGDPDAAIVALEPVERIVEEGKLGEPWLVQWAPDLIEAYSRVGSADRAAEVLGTFERQAQAPAASPPRPPQLVAVASSLRTTRSRGRSMPHSRCTSSCRRRSSGAGPSCLR